MIEVDEDTYNRQQAVMATLTKVAQHPKAKLLLQQAHREVDPQAIAPDLDRDKAENEKVSALQKEFADYKAEQEKLRAKELQDRSLAEMTAKIEGGLARLKRDYRLTDEGVAHVRKIMEDEGIVNPDAAYAVFEKRNPPDMPATPRGGSGPWNFLDIPDQGDGTAYAKKLLDTHRPGAGGGELVLDREVHAALNGLRGQ